MTEKPYLVERNDGYETLNRGVFMAEDKEQAKDRAIIRWDARNAGNIYIVDDLTVIEDKARKHGYVSLHPYV